ncbi:MAG: Gfo/Idh/MocA family oxidoreductase [Cephaloticoccus sp.]|nr:Gfo/Idh/MocA family oxidoreductase [Cephaloticoccus sp.]MCF7760481.1 Gfo/Idh/MocA family oxidoreductase [Cephaloticoccus sp.]
MAGALRVGLIGAGANTRERHIPGFRAIAGVEIVTVANRSEASSQQIATQFDIPRIAPDWQAVVADPEVDAVCIGTWPYLHAEITLAALAAGKHVLTEARMARNAEEALQMLAAAKARPDLVAQVVPSPMTLPVDATIARYVAEGRLGKVREVCVNHTTAAYADAFSPLTWRQDIELSGHNTLTLGIYYEAVLRWMGADAKVESARAAINTSSRARADGSIAAVKIPDSLTVLASYPGGARLVMHLSGVEPGAARNEFRLNGSLGGLRLEVATASLYWCSMGGQEERVIIPTSEHRGWRVEADFVDAIRTGSPVRLTDFATGLRTMQFTDEVWRAWSEGLAGSG